MRIEALLLVGFLGAACRSGERAAPAAEARARSEPPASALAGAVRALETLDAVRPEGTLSQLRALEADRLVDPAGRGEVERVLLHLTVYAATGARARAAFDEVRAALEHEAGAAGRSEPAPAERVRRAFGELDWDPPGREDLLSYSDTIHLSVRPGGGAAAVVEAAGGPEPSATLESYVRSLAARERLGQVDLTLVSDAEASGGALRCRIEPRPAGAHYTLAAIGAFLSALESESPGARLTRVRVERSPDEPDVHAASGWTFGAELAVRGAEPGPATAARR